MDKNVCENIEQLKNVDAPLFSFFYILIYTIKCVYAACFVFATNENGRQSTERNESIAKSNPTSEKKRMNLRNKVG